MLVRLGTGVEEESRTSMMLMMMKPRMVSRLKTAV